MYSLRPTSSRSTIYLFIYLFIYFIFKFFLTDPRSPIPRSPDSSILDPDFPVNHDVLLIKIILFFLDHWSDRLFQNNQPFQSIEFVDRPVGHVLHILSYGHEVLQVECVIVKYKATHINTSVTHTTLGWISTDAFLSPHVNERKF